MGQLNLLSLSFGVLFIGLGVDFAIHLGMAYAAELRGGQVHEASMREAVRNDRRIAIVQRLLQRDEGHARAHPHTVGHRLAFELVDKFFQVGIGNTFQVIEQCARLRLR